MVAVEALRPLVHAKAQEWSTGDPHAWVWETHALAKAYVYPRLARPPACHAVGGAPQAISGAYLAGAAPIVRVQLARAAVRLAVVLNRALAS